MLLYALFNSTLPSLKNEVHLGKKVIAKTQLKHTGPKKLLKKVPNIRMAKLPLWTKVLTFMRGLN